MDEGKRQVEFDKVLEKVGEFGAYQRRVFFLLCLSETACVFYSLGYVFWAARPPHWCEPPLSPALGNMTHEEILNLTVPWEEQNGQRIRSQCFLKDITFDNQTEFFNGTDYGNEWWMGWNGTATKACDKWEYDTSVYKSTIVTELNLVCDSKYWVSATQSSYMAGTIAGSAIYGYIVDRFGRRKTIVAASAMAVVFNICSAFAPNVYLIILFRILLAVSTRGDTMAGFVMVMEIVGPSWRSFTGTCLFMFWAFGYVVLAGIAYAVRDRFTLQLCISLPMIVLFIYYWLIPESPRWLLAKGRKKEADAIIQNIAKTNSVELPADIEIIIKEKQKSTSTPLDLLRSKNIRNITLILFFLWTTNNVVYYGLTLNTSTLGGNHYFNFFLAGVVEIPAYIVQYILLKYCNRRWSFAGIMAITGLMLFTTWPAPQDLVWLRVMLATMGKFTITISFGILYVYSAELFPTVMRGLGIGACNVFSRLLATLIPYTTELDEIQKGLPLLIFGTMSLISAIVIMFLPNTKTTQLSQTIEEGEASLRLSFPRFKCKKSTVDKENIYGVSPNGKKSEPGREAKPLITEQMPIENTEDISNQLSSNELRSTTTI